MTVPTTRQPRGYGRLPVARARSNYMPLARFALYAEGVEIYIAPTWDSDEIWLAALRHIAAEGRCWVIGAGSSLRATDVPRGFPGRAQRFPDDSEWLNPGDSAAVALGVTSSPVPCMKNTVCCLPRLTPVALPRRIGRSTWQGTTAGATSFNSRSTEASRGPSTSRTDAVGQARFAGICAGGSYASSVSRRV